MNFTDCNDKSRYQTAAQRQSGTWCWTKRKESSKGIYLHESPVKTGCIRPSEDLSGSRKT